MARPVRRAAATAWSSVRSAPTLPRGWAIDPSGLVGPCPEKIARVPTTRTHGKGSTRPGGSWRACGRTIPRSTSLRSMVDIPAHILPSFPSAATLGLSESGGGVARLPIGRIHEGSDGPDPGWDPIGRISGRGPQLPGFVKKASGDDMRKGLSSVVCASVLLGTASLAMAGAYGEPVAPEEGPAPVAVAPAVVEEERVGYAFIGAGALYAIQNFHCDADDAWGYNIRAG